MNLELFLRDFHEGWEEADSFRFLLFKQISLRRKTFTFCERTLPIFFHSFPYFRKKMSWYRKKERLSSFRNLFVWLVNFNLRFAENQIRENAKVETEFPMNFCFRELAKLNFRKRDNFDF